MTVGEAIKEALRLAQERKFSEAEALYRQVLQSYPTHPETLNLMGVLQYEKGNPTEAIDYLSRALLFRSDYLDARANLGVAYQQMGQLEKAIDNYRLALNINPKAAGIYNNLGNALQAAGREQEAIDSYRRAIELDPSMSDPHGNLGNVLKAAGKSEMAVASYREALRLRPGSAQILNTLAKALMEAGDLTQAKTAAEEATAASPEWAEAHNTLGSVFAALGRMEEAAAAYRRAIGIDPQMAMAFSNLGNALLRIDHNEAIANCRKAIALDPQLVEAQINLGIALEDAGHLDEAVSVLQAAIALRPENVAAHLSLGNAHKDRGEIDEAVAAHRRAAELSEEAFAKSKNCGANYSNLLYTLHFHPDYDAQAILKEHVHWARIYADPLGSGKWPTRASHAGGRVRIGYVSADLRNHVVGRHMLPLLAHHDHKKFEIFCYSTAEWEDFLTAELRPHADHWHAARGKSDDELAEIIRADGIDILVDLTLHLGGARMFLFARKPAPIQATYLAYCSTSGLAAMDYRLSDPYLDPPGTDGDYVEKTIRLAHTYWCYKPGGATPAVKELPAARAGFVTFGSLNNFAKVSRPALELWGRLLAAVPNSKLLINVAPGSHRQKLLARFAGMGIGPERIELYGGGSWDEYIVLHERIDIALDPFPYAGGITSCDAIWMGVPIVTLRGRTGVGRGGMSILSNVGLPELIGNDPQEYLRIATELAGDLGRLAELRRTLRQRMIASPLMDAPGFARDVEKAYGEML